MRGQHSQLQYLEARNAACKQPFRGNPLLNNETLVELFQQAALAGGFVHPLDDDDSGYLGEPHGISSRLVAAVLAIGRSSDAAECLAIVLRGSPS